MVKRFSKARLVEELFGMASRRAEKHGFTTSSGWKQVEGKGESANREYAEWRILREIAQGIEDGYLGTGNIR